MPLGMLLEMAAEGWGDRIVIGRRSDGLTASGLLAAARGGAHVLTERGASSVAFLDINGPAFVVALWSAALAGLPFCPLNYRLSSEQMPLLLSSLANPLVIGADKYRGLLGDTDVPFLTTEDFVGAARGDGMEQSFIDDDTTAVLLFTSGTVATPKAVVLTHENLVAYVLESVEFGSASKDDTILVCMPPYHVAGVNGAITNIYSGRRLIHLPNFDPVEWIKLVREEGVTHAMVVPTMLARIVEELGNLPAQLPTLRHLAYGGARMPRPVLERALAAFPDAEFVNAYGLTETSSTIAVLGPEDHRAALTGDDSARLRLSSVGKLLPGVEAVIRDESGTPIATGESGELWLRGRQISGNYLDKPSALDADGWFPTHDRAHLDEGGYLYIEGRADDTIIRGGENIAPAEIEEVLLRHPAITEAAVVGYPDDEWGERIVAVVVQGSDRFLTDTDVRQFARSHLRGSRTPDEVVFLPALPYTATGKLVRRELLQQLLTRADKSMREAAG